MTLQKWIKDRAIHGYPTFSIEDVRGTGMYSSEQIMKNDQPVEDKVNNILYQYHENVQPSKETLCQDFLNFKDKPYGYEQQIAAR